MEFDKNIKTSSAKAANLNSLSFIIIPLVLLLVLKQVSIGSREST